MIKAIMDKDSSGSYFFLEVRQPQEYVEGHIPGAVFQLRNSKKETMQILY